MAKRALEAMRLVIPDTADSIEAQLVGAGKIIPTWDPPAASSPLAKAQFAPLLIGQLKAIADPFYTALRDTDSEWVLAQLAENGTMDLANPDNFFPWTSDGADNADKAIATIGQLKAVFSLRFESIPLTLDAEDAGVNDQDVITGVVEGTPQASPPNYEIQFRKGNKFQKKFGYAPWEPTPTNISTRYLTKYLSTGATANDINRTRLSGSDWQIGFTNQISAQRVIWFTAADHGRKNSYNILSGEENIGAGYLPYSVYYTWDWNLATWRGKWYFDESYSYDFPPYNLNWDAPARVFYEESLADENTIEMVKQTALDNPPAYPSGWTNGKPWATWDISDDDLGVTYSRFIFRFKKRDVNTDSPPVSAGVYFMPKGSSAQQLLKTISWNGKTAKSADCFVDPKALRRGLDGDFHIGFSSIRFELDVAQQDQREAGETVVIPANDTDSGGGNAPDKASPVARFPGMDDSWYTGANITLTKMSGAGKVRFKVGTTEVPLGTNLAPAYFKSGGQFKGGKWKIEGVTAGPVKMILAYTKGNTTMSATRTATVIRGDLDMDSDNSGAIASTEVGKVAEENIENDLTKPGKIVVVRPDSLNDADGVPNSVVGLAELRINASGFKSSDLIKFSYDGSNPSNTQSATTAAGLVSYQNAAGALRIWKKTPGDEPPVLSGYVAPSISYTLSNLGIVPGTETMFYVQGVRPSLTKSYIKVEMSSNGVVVKDTVAATVFPIDILEVISDQIGGNEANKLPTGQYVGAPNNPMLMACRTGVDARLAIKMDVPAAFASSVLVGARKVGTGSVMNPAVCAAPPGMTQLKFDVFYSTGSLSNFYEIVAGYDVDGNHILSTDEIAVVFQKTPKTDSSGAPVAVDESIIDKIRIISEDEFVNRKTDLILNNVWGSEYTGDLISVFGHGGTYVNEATSTYPHLITSTQTGLSHPVGARWNSSNSAETYKFSFYNGSKASEDVKLSNGFGQVLIEAIAANIAAIKSATPVGGGWGTSGPFPFVITKKFQDTDSEWVGINELGYAFGKVDIAGDLTVSARWIAGGKIEVGTVSYSGQFGDLYDFSYWPTSARATDAARVQAGHATLSSIAEPNSGRVFFTNVSFSGSKDINKEY